MTAALYSLHADRSPVEQPKLRGRVRGAVCLAHERRMREEAESRHARASRHAAIQEEARTLREETRRLIAMCNSAEACIAKPRTSSATRKQARQALDEMTKRLAECDSRMLSLVLELWR